MTRFTREMQKWIVPTLVGAILLVTSCKKDKVPSPTPTPEPTKWEKIEGTYKVYDTLGVYLYDMNIIHVPSGNNNTDSLKFENFDGEFTFTYKQEDFSNEPELLIRFGYHDTLVDSNLKRWKILYSIDSEYDNVLNGDTLKMNFAKTNINYYIEDLTPYYACDCKQIAVKQH